MVAGLAVLAVGCGGVRSTSGAQFGYGLNGVTAAVRASAMRDLPCASVVTRVSQGAEGGHPEIVSAEGCGERITYMVTWTNAGAVGEGELTVIARLKIQ